MGKRKITIIIEERSIEDDNEILKDIGESFPDDDLKIQIKSKVKPDNAEYIDDEISTIECDTIAREALDENDTEYQENKSIIDEEKASQEVKEFQQELDKHAVKVSIGTLIKIAFEAFFGPNG